MKRIAFALFFLALPVLAQDQTATQTPMPPRDERTEMVARDLHAVGRVVSLAEDLGRERQVLLAIVDNDVRELREPREDGTYRWASLQREEGGRVKDEKTIEHVYTEKELRKVTISGPNGYRVEVNVPRKRGTFSANNRVWIGNVLAEITRFDGTTGTHNVAVNAWVNPGDSHGTPLPEIGRSVKATVELGVESGSKQAVAEVALVQARLVDDPTSPYFPAVKRLHTVRDHIAAKDMNRGAIKNAVDEALLNMPGELENRLAAQEEAARVRRMMAESGTITGAVNVGDATPDVLRELGEIKRLLSGTLEEQTEGRARLDTLMVALTPKMTVE